MRHGRDLFHVHRDRHIDAAVVAAELPEDRFLRAHREAAEARDYRCRFCGEHSSTATCDACADDAGW